MWKAKIPRKCKSRKLQRQCRKPFRPSYCEQGDRPTALTTGSVPLVDGPWRRRSLIQDVSNIQHRVLGSGITYSEVSTLPYSGYPLHGQTFRLSDRCLRHHPTRIAILRRRGTLIQASEANIRQ